MPLHTLEPALSPDERCRQVAAILAKGVIRWRRRAKNAGIIDASELSPDRKTGLDLCPETRLSVVNGTRGLWPRDVGDDA